MASIFFNFGTSGAAAGEQTYYFDDVAFGESITGFENAPMVTTTIYPNPTRHAWAIAASANITEVVVFDVMGRRVLTQAADSEQVIVDGSRLAGGVYFARLVTESGGITISLVKE
jgi:hypothetical protein